MSSTLAWLDHDASARERTKRLLALFEERGTVDQLGIGSIRDSFADLFFPGTSTIQTRLRYFLFIPWIYSRLEEDEVPSRRIAAVARERELALTEPLLSGREEGVFGRMAGGELKRLPSEVYWGGLGSWRIRRFDASRDQYHQAVDEIYRRRKLARGSAVESGDLENGVVTWHSELPAPPEGFPEHATLSLTAEEARFLRDRIVAEHPSSLVAFLALRSIRTEISYPWDHPLLGEMEPEHRRALHQGRMFSEVMAGAPILYNRILSEEADRDDLREQYVHMHAEWAAGLDQGALQAWHLDELFLIARGQGGHTISGQTETFVRRWVALVRQDAAGVAERDQARNLIRHRETLLKGARSYLRNRRALAERYNGGLGIGQISYRWADVQVLLNDLFDGLQAG